MGLSFRRYALSAKHADVTVGLAAPVEMSVCVDRSRWMVTSYRARKSMTWRVNRSGYWKWDPWLESG
ncbi:MAG: hypothetical protein QOD02_773 [Mycobacterium sp.]|nr:hypothetical protein [Mycobacterium sp.]